MADLSLFQGGGEIPIGGAVMLVDNRDDFTNDQGQRFLRSGFVETNTAGLDASVVSEGSYYEQLNPSTNWTVSNNYANGGLYVGQTGLTIANTAVRNLLIAPTTSSPFVEVASPRAGGFNRGNIVDNSGAIVTAFANSSSSTPIGIFRSTDGGTSFTNVFNTPSFSNNSGFLSYSRATGVFLFVATGAGAVYYSPDGITWTLSATSFSSLMNIGASVCPPESVSDPWLMCTIATSTTGILYRSVDDGVTWQQIGTQGAPNNNVAFPSNQIPARVYRIAGRVFVVVAGASFSTNISTYEIDQNAVSEKDLVLRVYNFTLDTDPLTTQFLGSLYFSRNGDILAANNKIIQGTLSSVDGVSASRETFGGGPLTNDGSRWYFISGLYGGNALFGTVPVAGSALAYEEGGASQFVRIS